MIPKIIHYCWLSDEELPKQFQLFLDDWKKKLPDYEFILWNFEKFDIDHSLWVKEAFNKRKYAFAADYIRLYALYNYGGIYLDLDVEVIKKFDDLLQNNFILGFESDNNAIEAGIIGAEKNSNWIADCLKYYEGKNFINNDGSFNTTPLPYILYSIISSKYPDYLSKVLPFDFLTAKSLLTREVIITANTYSVHHFAGSWTPLRKRFKKRLKEILGKRISLFLIGLKNKLSNI